MPRLWHFYPEYLLGRSAHILQKCILLASILGDLPDPTPSEDNMRLAKAPDDQPLSPSCHSFTRHLQDFLGGHKNRPKYPCSNCLPHRRTITSPNKVCSAGTASNLPSPKGSAVHPPCQP